MVEANQFGDPRQSFHHKAGNVSRGMLKQKGDHNVHVLAKSEWQRLSLIVADFSRFT